MNQYESPLEAKLSSPKEGGPSFSFGNRINRLFWKICWAAFASWSPPFAHRYRVGLLNLFGAKVHPSAHVYSSVNIWYPRNLCMGEFACLGPRVNCYNMAPISLGVKAIVSQGAHLCAGTHDIDDPNHQLVTSPIEIHAGAWIAAEAFIGPGVIVGENAVVGARAVLVRDAIVSGVYAGNPAKLLRKRR